MRVRTHHPEVSRGISTVVGAALAVLILTAFFTGVYMWTDAVEQTMSQLDWEREHEQIEVAATFTLTEDGNPEATPVTVTVKNVGAVDARVVRLWLILTDTNQHLQYAVSPPKNVPAGAETRLTINGLTVNLVERSSFRCLFKVVTDRGNIAITSLVSAQLAGSTHPVVLIPRLSYVRTDGEITLVIWNSLERALTIDYIVVTEVAQSRRDSGVVCPPGQIVYLQFPSQGSWNTYGSGETVLVELISDGFVVCAHYFTVES